MTTTIQGYQIPSVFKMIKSINNESPNMLLVHKDEFNRINKKVDNNKQLSKPYTDYIQMLYIKYILNKKKIPIEHRILMNSHIGMKMLQTNSTDIDKSL